MVSTDTRYSRIIFSPLSLYTVGGMVLGTARTGFCAATTLTFPKCVVINIMQGNVIVLTEDQWLERMLHKGRVVISKTTLLPLNLPYCITIECNKVI